MALGAGEYRSDRSTKAVLKLSKTAGGLVNVNILELLNGADDPQSALDMHLKHIEKTSEEIDDTVEILQAESQKYLYDSQECLAEKNAGDMNEVKILLAEIKTQLNLLLREK